MSLQALSLHIDNSLQLILVKGGDLAVDIFVWRAGDTYLFGHFEGRNGFLIHFKGHVLHLVSNIISCLWLKLPELVIPNIDGAIIVFKFPVFRRRGLNSVYRFGISYPAITELLLRSSGRFIS